MAKKQTTPKPVAKKAPARKDTTVVTPRYKVTAKEIEKNVVAIEGKGIGGTSFIKKKPPVGQPDTTRLKMKANDQYLNTTLRRNAERRAEKKAPLPNKRTYGSDGTLLWVQKDGLSYKQRPIKSIKVPKKKK